MSHEEFTRFKQRDEVAIRMDELPPEFLEALRVPVDDAELVALNHLVEDE
jgi:hypothetical protein